MPIPRNSLQFPSSSTKFLRGRKRNAPRKRNVNRSPVSRNAFNGYDKVTRHCNRSRQIAPIARAKFSKRGIPSPPPSLPLPRRQGKEEEGGEKKELVEEGRQTGRESRRDSGRRVASPWRSARTNGRFFSRCCHRRARGAIFWREFVDALTDRGLAGEGERSSAREPQLDESRRSVSSSVSCGLIFSR